jgi:hypothetical protein
MTDIFHLFLFVESIRALPVVVLAELIFKVLNGEPFHLIQDALASRVVFEKPGDPRELALGAIVLDGFPVIIVFFAEVLLPDRFVDFVNEFVLGQNDLGPDASKDGG